MYKEYPSIYKEAFLLAMEWAYYESEINIAYEQGRVCSIQYDPNLMTYTVWDIGGAWGGDDTSIWFFQVYNKEVRFIDYWEWSGYSMLYILEHIIKPKPYMYAKHIGPHDMNVHEYTTGLTRLQAARQMWYDFELIQSPKWAIDMRIDITRTLFSKFWFDESKCWAGLTKLKKYKRKRDEKNGVFMNTPDHNQTSHVADSIGYGAQYMSETRFSGKEKSGHSTMKMNRKL
jgi:hypothetical protein